MPRPPACSQSLSSPFLLTALHPTSHPSDEKEFSFPRNISAGSLGSLLGHHHGQGAESDPHVTEPLIGGVPETRLDVEREVSGEGSPAWVGSGPDARLQAGWAELHSSAPPARAAASSPTSRHHSL